MYTTCTGKRDPLACTNLLLIRLMEVHVYILSALCVRIQRAGRCTAYPVIGIHIATTLLCTTNARGFGKARARPRPGRRRVPRKGASAADGFFERARPVGGRPRGSGGGAGRARRWAVRERAGRAPSSRAVTGSGRWAVGGRLARAGRRRTPAARGRRPAASPFARSRVPVTRGRRTVPVIIGTRTRTARTRSAAAGSRAPLLLAAASPRHTHTVLRARSSR